MESNQINWIFRLKKEVPIFLNKLKGKKRPGFYNYSLTGDYFSENIKWGLGNSVFFLKIIYTLDLEDKYRQEINEAANYIKSFQKKNGIFNDHLVNVLSLPIRIYSGIKKLDFNNILNGQTKRAETRQAFSALNLFKIKANYEYTNIPKNKEEINKYLEKLNWNLPWSAGSHFSHLLFFLYQSNLDNKQDLIEYGINWVNKLQHKEDGFWYQNNSSQEQKINGAMKIITGLKAVNKVNFNYAQKIIDNCLIANNNLDACHNFNITYVLKYCNEVLNSNYRFEEIKIFMYNRLEIYKEYYHKQNCGFSFHEGNANKYYYNALLTKGRNEPDIHGTVMFLWGISLIAQVLGINNELKFKEFIT